MNSIVVKPAPAGALSTELAQAAERAAEYVRSSVPANTQRAYAADWATFTEWCAVHRAQSLPADPRVIASFVADQAKTLRPSSLRRRLAAIAKMHKIKGLANPCGAEPVPSTMKGIEATHGTAVRAKAPATLSIVEKMVATCRIDSLEGIRNRAILLLGYAAAMRRSELVALNVPDLEWTHEGVILTIRRSKTDQRGEGKRKAIPFVEGPFCAARALKAWLIGSGIDSGPVFRAFSGGGVRAVSLSPQAVAVIVKHAAAAAGLPAESYSGHSLRAGHVTEARAQGVSDALTMNTTGHKRVETLNMYDRRSNLFEKTSAGSVLTKK